MSPKRKGQRTNRNRKSPNHLYPQVQPFSNEETQSRQLEEVLYNLGLYDSPEGLAKRQEALDSLEDLLNDWSSSLLLQNASTSNKTASTNEQQPQAQQQQPAAAARVALISFGSYRLRVHKPDADMDLLALCPSHCLRQDFFASLVQRLKSDPQNVQNVHPISAAYTPVIKFTYKGIAIDLLFARLRDDTKLRQPRPEGTLYTIDDSDLQGLDEGSVRSLNGVRVAQLLDTSVPNLETFRTTLRAVKEWAHVHGLYSNVMGFLGGINYALLVACVCRRHHQNATPATLLKAFFQTYAQWNWPTPVALTQVAYQPPAGVMPLPVWDARMNPRDRMHVMPILTPTYPSMNSAYNVGIPQLRRLVQAFRSASTTLQKIDAGTNTWMDLFQGKKEFFRSHEHFLQVNIMAMNGADFMEWFRFVESRLRLLIAGLDNPHYGVQAEPFCQFYDRQYDQKGMCVGPGKSAIENKTESCLYIALRFRHDNNSPVDLSYLVADFLHKINTWDGRSLGMDLTMEMVKQNVLPPFLLMQQQDDDDNVVVATAAAVPTRTTVKEEEPVDVEQVPTPVLLPASEEEPIQASEQQMVPQPDPQDEQPQDENDSSAASQVEPEQPPVISWAMKVRGAAAAAHKHEPPPSKAATTEATRSFVSPAKRART